MFGGSDKRLGRVLKDSAGCYKARPSPAHFAFSKEIESEVIFSKVKEHDMKMAGKDYQKESLY